jgi:peptidoglycan biosynthesis protein MviN/MurJ (putative lipid II flippase)
MRWFGHVGIALAPPIAAFVSLGQYIRGLYKRDYWRFSRALLLKLGKLAAISILTGLLLFGEMHGLTAAFPQIIGASKILLLFILGAVIGSGAVFFLILAKIFGIIDFAEIVKMLRRR